MVRNARSAITTLIPAKSGTTPSRNVFTGDALGIRSVGSSIENDSGIAPAMSALDSPIRSRDDASAALSFRNLPHVQVISPGELNTYDVLCNDWIVFSKDVVPANEAPAAAQPKAKAVEAADATDAKAADATDAKAADADAAAAEYAAADADNDGEANAVDASPHGEGSHAPIEGDEMPEGFPIKGNAGSMLYHLPDTAFYGRTIAEVWFATEDAAKAAGFSRPASQLKQEASTKEEEA